MGLGPKFSTTAGPRLGEPQAHRFSIEEIQQVGTWVLALVRYPDASEHGGAKVLLYRSTTVEELKRAPLLDPHFLEASRYPVPFARFEPTPAGLAAALVVAENL